MSLTAARVPVPSSAERIRTVLTGATSLTLTTHRRIYDLIDAHTVTPKGQLRLHPPADSPLASEVACAPRGALAALLHFTDIAPTAVRDRVRARVTLSGWLSPAGPDDPSGTDHASGTDTEGDGASEGYALRLDTARATIEAGETGATVGLDEVILAEADPLAREEAALLTHLTDDHADLVARLAALAGPRPMNDTLRVTPFALDRYGITLRYEYARGHGDLRIAFPAPLTRAEQLGERIHQLLTAAHGCPHDRRRLSH
ncbi:DUF2470 domain-containing protein [Streptomyces sp. FIT100]|uniref:DUF2470 domain-containing protein n=1 Tax=Streptomyces sp. FIT100 TaxID=2837956 RepID=UPI0021C5C338|nr:DUF2470 domain-containing protein [Streptomyces sp. FIT100]UUN30650.1 DUF2470 domain-containing protein [Streptomyces sp. FIT100]